ncbi:MAG TPA: hypothetical protein VJ742_10855, partial [Nitrososphaera sp.]|nr:hypothetical protein [Nitrososphaera sp.]
SHWQAPPTAAAKVGTEKTPQLSQQQKQASTGAAGTGGKSAALPGETVSEHDKDRPKGSQAL